MPTYEYVCSDCQNQWEETQRITEPALEVCPKCHKKTARRQISGGNFILKGGGWYSDLYSGSSNKSDTKAKSDSSGTDSKSDSGSSGTAASTTKGETKSEKKESTAPAAAAPAAPAASSGTGGASKT